MTDPSEQAAGRWRALALLAITLVLSMSTWFSASAVVPQLRGEWSLSDTAAVFEAYVEQELSPELRAGQVIVLDNLGAHKGVKVRELIEERGCEVLYLPPYSPDLNPIEEAFSKVKGLLRRTQPRKREALLEAIGQALSTVTARDARGFFKHCGYRLPLQPP